MLQLEPSPLQLPTLHSGSSPALPFTYWLSAQGCSSIFGKYLNAHLTFMVYGRKHRYIHTHFCNAVPLVWGSLRLAPTTTPPTHFLTNDEALLIEGGTAILVMQHFLVTSSEQYSCPPTTPSFLRLWALVILRVGLGVHKFPCYHCDYMCAHVHIARSCIIASSLWHDIIYTMILLL